MELRQLRYFVAVAEELHFGRAASRLHVVQPAVSQQVARLEREFGLRLLDRSPRRVRLTEAGERLLAEARNVLAAADQTCAVAAQLVASGRRSLRIGTSPGVAAALERAIDALHQLAPELGTALDGRPAHEQVAAVRRGELDLAVVRGGAGGPGVQALELWREPVVVAVPAAHSVARQSSVRLEDLADLPLRLPSAECDPLFGELVRTACRRAGFEPRLGPPVTTVTNALLEIGSGMAAWTALYADSHHGTGTRKAVVLPVDPALTAPVSLVVPATQAPECVAALHEAFASSGASAAGVLGGVTA